MAGAEGSSLAGQTTLAEPAPAGAAAADVAPSLQSLLDAANLGGMVGFVVADARSGQVLEQRNATLGLPPASVAKTMTTLYALDVLGPAHRFVTWLLATGPVQNGTIAGDLILGGGGDPTLSTDGLASMVKAMKAQGITGVAGRFLVWGGALPQIERIDREQPEQVAYNPAIGGLNLNFNRVYFEWKRAGNGYTTSLDARSDLYRPAVRMASMRVVPRAAPLYTFAGGSNVDQWSVAESALGKGGSRWLPVRQPALYAGQAFQGLAAAFGIRLPNPRLTATAPKGTVLVRQSSADLASILKDMLRFSTNMTAEIIGLAASRARGGDPRSLAASAGMMNDWLRQKHGLASARFVDHSGLEGATRIAPADLVKALVRAGPDGALRSLLRSYAAAEADVTAGRGVQMFAKTGTLNFVSGLAGYVTPPDGRELVFAILCADAARRDQVPMAEREMPDGNRAWTKRARGLQRALIGRWAMVYGV